MVNIVIGSINPVKIEATLHGFTKMFPGIQVNIQSISVPSGVSIQPLSNAETLTGAIQRARNAARQVAGADYWVGIEGGIEDLGDEMAAFAWAAIGSPCRLGKGRTGAFILPEKVANLVRQGKELGEADDIVFNRQNSKQEIGAVGLLTGGAIDRALLYETAVILALIPFKDISLYPDEDWLASA